ncbi:hypothetical protein BC628DRAFT_626714 [Trametes gibbosa]|nr:hypothetical protein BC628DRAFT_626714 [Trametes gibbosa]
MDTLPSETLQQIFELACTDGGSTGNALSLTSKGVRAAARRVRFHSLYLIVGRAPLQEFVAFLSRECSREEGEPPRVRHLFLSLPGDGESRDRPIHRAPQPVRLRTGSGARGSATYAAAQSATVLDVDHSTSNEPSQSSFLSTSEAVQKLFALVARDLWSLAIHVRAFRPHPDLQLPILEHTFPLVREAAFLGICEPKRLLRAGAPLSLVFPAATHLDLAPPPNDSKLSLPEWYTIAPRVSHLYISGIRYSSQNEQLAEAIGARVATTTSMMEHEPSFRMFEQLFPREPAPPLPPRTYPTVRYLLIEPARYPRGFSDHIHGAFIIRLTYTFMSFRKKPRTPSVDSVAVLLQPMPRDERTSTERDLQHLRNWRGLVEGTEGWWVGDDLFI